MYSAYKRHPFYEAHVSWANNDFEGLMALFAEDIVYTTNVDGLQVPYAASAVGKDEVRRRLKLLLDTFLVQTFVIDFLVHETDFSRSLVLGCYAHKKTGERLEIKLRFHGWLRDGLLTRVEEYHDAAYIEAFQRLVTHLTAAAQADGPKT